MFPSSTDAHIHTHAHAHTHTHIDDLFLTQNDYVNMFPYLIRLGPVVILGKEERWGAGVETQKNVRGEIGGWCRVPFNETYAPLLSTIFDGA